MSKIRIHALAKELNQSSKNILEKAKELNIDVKNHMSSLEADEETKIRSAFAAKGAAKKSTPEKKSGNAPKPETSKQATKDERKAQPVQKKSRFVADDKKNGKTPTGKNQTMKSEGKNQKPRTDSKPKNPNTQNKQAEGKTINNFQNSTKQHKSKNNDGHRNRNENPKQGYQHNKRPKERFQAEDTTEGKRNNHKKNNRKANTNNFEDKPRRPRDLTKKSPAKRKTRAEKKQERLEAQKNDGPAVIQAPISVKDFAEAIDKPLAQVMTKLIGLGVMASQNQEIDEDTCFLVAEELGVEVSVEEPEAEVSMEEQLNLDFEDNEADLHSRPPVVTVMGHVDHGKTSILDVIKKSHVQQSEAGGITQHIGAYTVSVNKKKITFLDTPGHEAFTSMRLRGALITDIAILVVAADDGVMPQTIEAISHAKSAGVPIIVAINKIDRPEANVDRVKQELLEQGLMSEDWGGDVIMVPVSAHTKEGIDDLLEMIILVAEMLELKANPDRLAIGTVIEARLDKGKGPMATVLVQKGTLKFGDNVVSGIASGHIRAMSDDKNRNIKKAGPSMPAVILGLSDVPNAGDMIYAVEDEKTARAIADKNREESREHRINTVSKVSLENLFARIKEGEMKDLNIVVKADVKGSVEALIQSLAKLSNEEVNINVIHSGVGGINESDITLASASNAIVVGFNVRPNMNAIELAKSEEVDVRTYRVIYDILDDVEKAATGMLDPDIVEEVMGRCEVRQTFRIPGNIIIAGIYVNSGKILRNSKIRILRDDVVIHEGEVASLRRFKDDVKELNTNYEGGLGIENFNDIKEGDFIECYILKEVKRG
ncbi:translation initiation factor IF-2 [Peptoniphilus equinus]|uniref:Translation initiation factor IF-2 n=1 Tax=Peptoniphilus equinus TaxID=3016343 RepID=A0ABY7QWS6_9FIRM|nr:translation initiation factor IF-2 [Peptoniphilus equinus]WBW50678.1 translation initiation factor IF-2 [Peptoniphilus equinus]